MPATTSRGYPYPIGTDPVALEPQTIQQLAEAVNSKVGAIASGKTTVTMTATNGAGQAVNFPAGRFTAAPVVTATATNDNINVFAQVSAVTAAGFTVIARHRDNASTITANIEIHWIAVQQ